MKKFYVMAFAVFLQMLSIQTVSASDSFYMGVDFGKTTHDVGLSNFTGTAAIDEEVTSTKIFFGMPLFMGFNLEAVYTIMDGYTLTGTAGDTYTDANGSLQTIGITNQNSTSEITAYGLNLVYKTGLAFATVYAKAGFVSWTASNTTTGTVGVTPINLTSETTGTEGVVGAGVEIGIAPLTALRFDYEISNYGGYSDSTMALGVVVGF